MPSILDSALELIKDKEDYRVGLGMLHREALRAYIEALEYQVDNDPQMGYGTVGSVADIRSDVAMKFNFTGESQ
ncbi:MAG: hypothetical protein DRI46_10305 [Chloroflexi bacterium]|nr:MAG: hypothetical protein DRI46_10305 [Chloroflexota bacterium]